MSLLFERCDGQAVLIIEDNGNGYDSEAQNDVRGMGPHEHARTRRADGGIVEIESQSGAGTTVFVRVPVAENGHE